MQNEEQNRLDEEETLPSIAMIFSWMIESLVAVIEKLSQGENGEKDVGDLMMKGGKKLEAGRK